MAIAEKLQNIINEKQAQITMTNYGLPSGSKINSSTKFIDYPKYIFNAFLEALRTPDTLFTNLPKKSGSGAVISLNDTANVPMRIELGSTELTQDGTPTPSSPQAVHTISGSNKIIVCGKNLFDKNSTEDGKEIQSGSIINSPAWCVSDYIPVEYNKSYVKNIASGNGTIIYDKNYNVIDNTTRFNTNNVITIGTANAKYLRVNLPLTSKDTYQLEVGTSSTTYTPYISQEADIDLDTLEYCKIGTYEDKFIRTSGKNKWNEQWELGTINSSGEFVSDTTRIRSKDYIPVLPNTTYYYYCGSSTNSGRAAFYDASKNFISYNVSFKSNSSFTTPNNAYYMAFSPTSAYGTTYKNDIMINLGSTALPYEPYGNGTWYIKKNTGKTTITSFNGKSGATANNQFSTAVISNILKPSAGTIQSAILSNRFISRTPNYIYGHDVEGIGINTDGSITIGFGLSSGISTLELANTYASSNEIVAYYPLANPTYTQITGTLETQLENVYQKLLSYSGTTNISQVNNDLSFNMSVQAIEEL